MLKLRPKLVISKCLGFEKCRYDGQGFNNDIIKKLKEHVDFVTVCPEVEIGLATPRDPIRVVKYQEGHKLIQPKSQTDHTDSMKQFCKTYTDTLEDVDGFILKSKSPSCGIKDVKVYHNNGNSLYGNANGFFADEVLNRYSHLAIENEGRLKNYQIRNHFLTKIFTLRDFKNKVSIDNDNIKKFHYDNELLLKSHNKETFKLMDGIVSNKSFNKIDIDSYEEYLYQCLNKPTNRKNNLDLLINTFDKFCGNLKLEEKELFVDIVNKYNDKKLPLSVPLNMLKSYALRFDDNYLVNQSIFNPYPEELMEITDSGKGRDY